MAPRKQGQIPSISPKMAVNTIHSISIVEAGVEPVTPSQAKLHAAIDFDDYDSIIPTYIQAARMAVEKATGVALMKKTFKVQASIYPDFPFRLPFTPVQLITYISVIKHGCEELLSDYPVNYGYQDESIRVKYAGVYEIDYIGGYDSCPADYKLAILQMFAFIFSNRGDYNEGKLDVSLEAQRIMGQNQRFLV